MKILVHIFDGVLEGCYLFDGAGGYNNAVDGVSRILTKYGWSAEDTNALCHKLFTHSFVEQGEHSFQIVDPSKLP